MIELRHASKRFGDVMALEPTDLVLAANSIYVLLGTSGCGKSTLLKMVLGLVTPDSGSVHFQGRKLTEENVARIRQQIGYVIQNGGLFPHLTAEHNITIVARHLGWQRGRIDSRLQELTALTHLPADVLRRFPAQLSGGQQQRVALMRALMLDPDVLLMDEPLGALDPIIRRSLQTELRQIFRALNKTVVVVTHDLGEAAYFADEVLLMRAGRILQRGSITDLVDSPADAFVSEFISAHQISLSRDEP